MFSHPEYPLALRLFSYYIILFPSLDVISSYPLINHVISNNLYSLITGQDTSKEPRHRFDCLLRVLLRFLVALLPILAAFGVANLIIVLKYVGIFAFINFFFPAALQLRSICVCKAKFSKFNSASPSLDGDRSGGGSGQSPTSERAGSDHEAEKLGRSLPEEDLPTGGDSERLAKPATLGRKRDSSDRKGSLLTRWRERRRDRKREVGRMLGRDDCGALYLTPYSFRYTSHPAFVVSAILLGGVLFTLAFTGLFVKLERLTCEQLFNDLLSD